ncbi:putative molybdenum carrier protein [uncultured Thiodictyon sp.]|uniref:putative molybdenum carrier protein n=1 Tax=uncultured Thiodictyon sp. TaxID=1846217 RepID=UPI0025DBF076|nr:putative molybdenum carrier protein [uncultured Thiodictyon sp.]
MSKTDPDGFVPIVTVMPDYGMAPFLWLVDRPDEGVVGVNICNGAYWDESYPMSEGLWRKFADWAIAFDRTQFYFEDYDADGWDWLAFHARGLQLARWLKEEVSDAYRVVYLKPFEDPNSRLDEQREILPDGTLIARPALSDPVPDRSRLCRHIVSGGQTGADRGALDFAITHGYTHGGWAPSGRAAEDGPIPLKYQLIELAEGGYRERTRRNVQDSDGTLIVNLGELDGGTLDTRVFAQDLGKPQLVVPLDLGVSAETVAGVVAWLRQHAIKTLNVAGPRESKRPGIHRLTGELLKAADAAIRSA